MDGGWEKGRGGRVVGDLAIKVISEEVIGLGATMVANAVKGNQFGWVAGNNTYWGILRKSDLEREI